MLIIDEHGLIGFCNEATERLLGAPSGSFIGRAGHDLIIVDEQERGQRPPTWSSLVQGPRTTMIVHAHRVDGTTIPLAMTMTLLDGGAVACRLQHVHQWSETIATSRMAFDEAPIGMIIVSLTGGSRRIVRSANRLLCDFLGYEADELVGTDFHRLTHPDDAADSVRAVQALRAGIEQTHVRRKRYRHRDGHYLWAEIHARLLPGTTPHPIALGYVLDIGEQVALEETQRRNNENLQLLVEQRTTDLSRTAARLRLSLAAGGMSGWTYDLATDQLAIDQLSRTDQNVRLPANEREVRDLLHAEDLEVLFAAIGESMAKGQSFDVTVRGSGTSDRRWLRFAGDVIFDSNQVPIELIGVVQDVTDERELVEQALLRQQRLDLALDASQLGVWEFDTATGDGWFDDRAKAMLGLPLDQPVDIAEMTERVHPGDREKFPMAIEAGINANTSADTMHRVLHRDGSYRWIRIAGLPFTDPASGHLILIGLNRDVTEEQQAQQELRDHDEYLSLVLASTVTGIWDWDLAAGTIHFSDDWLKAYGYGPTEIGGPGWQWSEIVHPDDWQVSDQHLTRHLKGELDLFECECRIRRADGSWRWTRIRGQVTERDADGLATRLLAADTDITDKRRMEDQLVHASKMQSLGVFSGGIAHDFNNVLAVIRGHNDVAKRDDDLLPATKEHLAAVDRAIVRAASLVRELMMLGRPAGEEPVRLEIDRYLRDAWRMFDQLVGEAVTFHIDLADEPISVEIDQSRFEALVLNLIANACDAMPYGGKLNISTAVVDGGDWVDILVRDTGIGMGPATLNSMFDPYFTTKSADIGTGLGLATSYSTVTQAGGTITASSLPGVGTVVQVRLPRSASSHPALRPLIADHGAPAAAATILMVEDDAELLELNADTVRSSGHRVFEALDASDALTILNENPDIDLLITDALLPGMSGADLAQEAARRLPTLKVLFLSGYAPAMDKIDPQHLLIKPIGADDLIDAVNRRLGST